MEQFKKFIEPVAPLAHALFEFIKTPIGITILVLAVLSSLISAFAHHRGFDGARGNFGGGCPMMQHMKGDEMGTDMGRGMNTGCGMMKKMRGKKGDDMMIKQPDDMDAQSGVTEPMPIVESGSITSGN